MSFLIYDLGFLVIFCLALFIFLYTRRKNLKREGLMYLYRTKVGIRIINYVGTKYKKTLSFLSVISVISGYFLMIAMIYLLVKLVYAYLFVPELVRAVKIPPIMPLIPYVDKLVGVQFLPPFYFTYWIIIIAVLAVFHEFAHGIVAKRYGVRIKTTGFGFLGPFLAAFVEQDDKQMVKKTKFQQIAILSAGTFTNLILAILFFLLIIVFFNLNYAPSGAMFNSYAFGLVNTSSVDKINDFSIIEKTNQGILDIIEKNEITDSIILGKLNYTRISAENKIYYTNVKFLKENLKKNASYLVLYPDLPAINAGLLGTVNLGTVISINEEKVTTPEELANVLKKYSPGDEVKIIIRNNGNVSEYKIKLGENPVQKGRAIIGVGYFSSPRNGFLSKFYEIFNFFKQPATDYSPKYNTELIVFIYNLVWWLALINLSVALMNMLPFTIFDGGRLFMLSIWAVTRSQKFAEWAFRTANWIITGIILLLMISWAFAVF